MAKVYGKEYEVESARCYKCNGSSQLLTPLNDAHTAFQVSKCPYCEHGVATIWLLKDVPVITEDIFYAEPPED